MRTVNIARECIAPCRDLICHSDPERKPALSGAEAAGRGTFAYCGRYEVDVTNQRLIHLPEVASDPGYVGSRQVRPYRLEGDRMVLSDSVTNDPEVVRWTIIREKVSAGRWA